jgi:hypothetical protein
VSVGDVDPEQVATNVYVAAVALVQVQVKTPLPFKVIVHRRGVGVGAGIPPATYVLVMLHVPPGAGG